jgi:hypothetical protein
MDLLAALSAQAQAPPDANPIRPLASMCAEALRRTHASAVRTERTAREMCAACTPAPVDTVTREATIPQCHDENIL